MELEPAVTPVITLNYSSIELAVTGLLTAPLDIVTAVATLVTTIHPD